MQKENKYYIEIEHLIKKKEVDKTARLIKYNTDTLTTTGILGVL